MRLRQNLFPVSPTTLLETLNKIHSRSKLKLMESFSGLVGHAHLQESPWENHTSEIITPK